jgi:hypothetical protein
MMFANQPTIRRKALLFALASVSFLAAARPACAFRDEIGISIEPTLVVLPAVADQSTKSTLVPAGGGSLSIEYSILHELAVVVRGGYVQAFGDSLIGQTTIQGRPGNYYFQQNSGWALGGLRLETPRYWMPVSLFASALGGVFVLDQTSRALKEIGTGNDFGFDLADIVKTVPAMSVSVGLSGRVSHQIRLQVEPTLYMFLLKPVLVGFGLTAGITFLFYP